MKAAIINAKGQSPVYGEIEAPTASHGMILIDVKASALSHLSKVRSQGNHYSSDAVFPKVAGAEGVGVTAHLGAKKVIATGRNERELQELLVLGADVGANCSLFLL